MAGNGNSGRQTKLKENQVIRYYETLLPKVFIEVRDNLESKNKRDRRWAMEWLKTGIVKMIPQVSKIGGDKENDTPISISLLNGASQNVPSNNSTSQDSPTPETS